MAELLAVAGLSEELARDRVGVLAAHPTADLLLGPKLCAEDQVVDLAELVARGPNADRPRHVRAIPIDPGTDVDRDRLALLELPISRHGMGHRGIGPTGDDRRERRRRAMILEVPVDRDGDLPFG